jgi:hypothetical protein
MYLKFVYGSAEVPPLVPQKTVFQGLPKNINVISLKGEIIFNTRTKQAWFFPNAYRKGAKIRGKDAN